MRFSLPAALLVALLCASTALGLSGVDSGSRDVPPPDAKRLGPGLCRTDSGVVRIWWSETPGRLGALSGDVDGRCRTVPDTVEALAWTAAQARSRARTLGFPAIRGDAAPRVLRSRTLTRALLRLPPVLRGRALLRIRARDRGAFLAGFTASSRKRLLSGMPGSVRRRLLRDARAATRGVPSDFVGGDRRVDVIVDPSTATGRVSEARPAVALCRLQRDGARSPRVVFGHAYIVVRVDGDTAPTAALAHELFHVIQCNMAVNAAAPELLLEGTAEWFAGLVDPAGFATAPVTDATGLTTLRGGSSRVASFCTAFDPVNTAGLDAYNSWGVWAALGRGARPAGPIRAALLAYRGRTTQSTPRDLVVMLGRARWVNAVRTAAQSLCGELSAPFSGLRFPTEIRPFVGAGRVSVNLGATRSVVVPAWGLNSVIVRWATGSGGVVRVRAAGVDPSVLADSTVAATPDGPLAAVVRDGVVEVEIPSEGTVQAMVVTIANPLERSPLAVEVSAVEPTVQAGL